MKITVSTLVAAPLPHVWRAYTTPDDIKVWNTASPDWHTTAASVDLRPGGRFSSRMEAKDGSFGFDFAGEYTEVVPQQRIAYTFGDRVGTVVFAEGADGVMVTVTFDSEPSHSEEQQRAGWQAILDNFARHVVGQRRSSHTCPPAIARWHELVRTQDASGLPALIDDDAVFLSPIVHTPQVGKALTVAYLSAAFRVFFNPGFRYVREIVGERDAMLEFETTIDDVLVNGVDLIKWNADDRIIEFKVMVRPLKAIQLIHERMAALLASAGRGK